MEDKYWFLSDIVVKDRIMDLKDPLPLQFLDRIVDRKHISKEWKNDRLNCVSIRSSCVPCSYPSRGHMRQKLTISIADVDLNQPKIDLKTEKPCFVDLIWRPPYFKALAA